MTWKFDGRPQKQYGTSSILCQTVCIISKPSVNSNWSYRSEILNLGSKLVIFCPLWPPNLTDELENNRAHLLSYFKLCASFHSHLGIQNGVAVRKHQIWVKSGYFLSRVTLKFDRWPWKTIGHLFYATWSFVHHSIAVREFNLELQSGNDR